MPDEHYVVMFSGGIGSYWAARRIIEAHGADAVTLLFSDVKGDSTDPHVGEDEDNYRFIADAVEDLGARYVRVADGRTIWDVFKDKRFLGNARQANCSHLLKQAPARKWLNENTTPENTVIVIGIDWSETHRRPAIRSAYEPYAVEFPMCDEPFWDKERMIAEGRARGLEPPRLYSYGFAHANCGGGCVRSGQGQFKLLLDAMPERFAVWEQNEAALREYLDKDVAILRDRRGGTSTPMTLTQLRAREAGSIDMFDLGGCGCFVDERPVEESE